MSRQTGRRPHGQIRRSQLITSFGPGSMMDLPNHSVLIGGLDSWSTGGDEIIEPRLVDKLKQLFDPPLQVLKLYSPPPDNDDPTAPQTGITAWQFPEWFITQDVDSDSQRGTVRARMLVHRRMLTKGKFIDDHRKKRSVVPVRFVRACRSDAAATFAAGSAIPEHRTARRGYHGIGDPGRQVQATIPGQAMAGRLPTARSGLRSTLGGRQHPDTVFSAREVRCGRCQPGFCLVCQFHESGAGAKHRSRTCHRKQMARETDHHALPTSP